MLKRNIVHEKCVVVDGVIKTIQEGPIGYYIFAFNPASCQFFKFFHGIFHITPGKIFAQGPVIYVHIKAV